MAEITKQIAANSDDCYTFGTTIRLTNISVTLASRVYVRGYMRFLNILIPPGSTIEHAHLEVCSPGNQSGHADLVVHGIKEANTNTFSTALDADARPVTAASKDWIIAFPFDPYWPADTWHGWPDGPELKDIIQEQIDQPGWASANALALKIGNTTLMSDRSIWSYDGDPAKAPILVVTYTLPSMIQHILTIPAAPGGTTSPAPGSYLYNEGTIVEILAIPSAGYQFLNWSLNGLNLITDNPIAVVMEADHTLTAVFEEIIVPSKVIGLNAANITGTSFFVFWNDNPPEEEIVAYRVYLRKL